MKWTGELTIESVDFQPCGEVRLSLQSKTVLRSLGGKESAYVTGCDVSLTGADGVEVRCGKRYRVTVEEVVLQ